MSGIPVHTSSPINPNASKALGATPSTTTAAQAACGAAAASDALETKPKVTPTAVTATTTASPNQQSTPLRPGATAFPAPTQTPTTTYKPTSTISPPPTRTTYNPPAPQPGDVPSPYTASPSTRPTIPPPPKAGEIPQPALYYTPQVQPTSTPTHTLYSSPAPLPAHQQHPNLHTPTRAQPPAGTTTFDLSHPPGYMQNTRASFDERPAYNSPFDGSSKNIRSESSGGGGILDSSPGYQRAEEEKGIWDTAVSWAKTAGEKLSQGEQEVWKAINSKK